MRYSLVRLQHEYKPLSDIALAGLAQAKWKVEANRIWKRFALPSHTAAAQFALRVATQADRLNHHPEIAIKYRFITFYLSSNDVGRLSEQDENLAKIIDSLRNKD